MLDICYLIIAGNQVMIFDQQRQQQQANEYADLVSLDLIGKIKKSSETLLFQNSSVAFKWIARVNYREPQRRVVTSRACYSRVGERRRETRHAIGKASETTR